MMNSDDHNLGIFRILFIIKGIITLIFAVLPILYIFFGMFLLERNHMPDEDAHFVAYFIMCIGIFVFLILLVLGILTLLTAKYLGEKRNYDFIFIMSVISCITGIFGIILGIFTILELNKPHVKRLFGKPA